MYTMFAILIAIMLGLISVLIFAFIPLFGFAYFLAWYGRKRNIFQLPSPHASIRFFQGMFLSLLAVFLLANIAVRWNIFEACFDSEGPCPKSASQEIIGIPLIPDTLTEWEAIIKFLLPPFMRERCYTQNEFACIAAPSYMINQMSVSLAPYPAIWLIAVTMAVSVMTLLRRIFPDQRKQKRG